MHEINGIAFIGIFFLHAKAMYRYVGLEDSIMSNVTNISSQTSFLSSVQASSKNVGRGGASSSFGFTLLNNVSSGSAYTGSNVSLWGESVNGAFAQNAGNLQRGVSNESMGESLADAASTKIAFAQTQDSSILTGGKLSINLHANELTLASGITLTLPFINDGNFRVTENENGTVTVVTDMFRVTYDKDGNRIRSERGSFDPLTGTEGKDYIINRNGTYVNAGGGDDVIFQFSKAATISAGAGDDKIIFGDTVFDELTLNLGEGDDSIESHSLRVTGDLTVYAGGGDDSISIGTLQAGNLILHGGKGNDNIQIGSLTARSFALDGGEGDNSISIHSLLSATENTTNSLSAGDGDNKISIGTGIFTGEILVGGGNNSILLDQTKEALIQGGYGQNTVYINAAYLSHIEMAGKHSVVDIQDNQESTIRIAGEMTMASGALREHVLESLLSDQKQNDENISSENTDPLDTSIMPSSQTGSQRNTLMFKDDMAQQIENVLAQSIRPLRDTQQDTAL